MSSLNRSCLYYITKRKLLGRGKWMHSADPIYLKSCMFFGSTLIDRTGTLECGINYSIIDEIPIVYDFNLSFKEVCFERANEIVNKTSGNLKVLWSGGIDSTVALISLIEVFKRSNRLDRLEILLSKESIEEYPKFFTDVIEGQLNFKIIETTIFEGVDKSEIIITGEHGDQIFGSDKLKYAVMGGYAFEPYSDILEFVVSRKLGTEKYTSSIINYLEPQVNKSPIEISTLYDYLWWMNFSLKWQAVSMRLIAGLNRSASDLEHNVFHFFKSQQFQKWSIVNHNSKIKDEWRTYKYVAKEFIYDYHKDEEYLKNKEKEQSLKEVLVDKNRFSLRNLFRCI